MMGHREKLKTAREVDAVCAKHRLKYTERTGVAHGEKRQLSRRARRDGRRLLERGHKP